MTRLADGIEVEGPVQAEVFVVWLNGDHLELTGPCGAAPWLIELGEVEHPVAEGVQCPNDHDDRAADHEGRAPRTRSGGV